MPSSHTFQKGELPSMYLPWGSHYLCRKVDEAGFSGCVITRAEGPPETWTMQVNEPEITKQQLIDACEAPNGRLTIDQEMINVPPGTSGNVTISGPPGTPVKAQWYGHGYVPEMAFTLDGNGDYAFQIGPCPAGQCCMDPQCYSFYVEDDSVSPVGVCATFLPA